MFTQNITDLRLRKDVKDCSFGKEQCMKTRKKQYGDKNLVGRNIERLRKEKGLKQKDFIAQIQVMGCDMNPTSYSKLEGQVRSATDRELFVVSKILGVPMEKLFEDEND